MNIEKLKTGLGYAGKPKAWQDCFDVVVREVGKEFDILELNLCQQIVLHNNALTVIGAALIDLSKGDEDTAEEWLSNALENADSYEWSLFTDSQEYYDHIKLEWPKTVAEHQENLKVLNERYDVLNARLEAEGE